MIAGWKAVQEDSTLFDWFWVGLWMGLGFLSKYTNLFQLLSWVVFFAIAPGDANGFAAPALTSRCSSIWFAPCRSSSGTSNMAGSPSGMCRKGGTSINRGAFTAANLAHGFVRYTSEFVAEEVGLQNPFYFLPMVWAVFAFWRVRTHQTLQRYFFQHGRADIRLLFIADVSFTLPAQLDRPLHPSIFFAWRSSIGMSAGSPASAPSGSGW